MIFKFLFFAFLVYYRFVSFSLLATNICINRNHDFFVSKYHSFSFCRKQKSSKFITLRGIFSFKFFNSKVWTNLKTVYFNNSSLENIHCISDLNVEQCPAEQGQTGITSTSTGLSPFGTPVNITNATTHQNIKQTQIPSSLMSYIKTFPHGQTLSPSGV